MLLATLVAPVALAGQPAQLSAEDIAALSRHFTERLELNSANAETLADAALLDGSEDFFTSAPEHPLFAPSWGDIRAEITWEVDLAQSFTMNQTCGEAGVMCPQGMEQPASGTYYAYTWMSLDEIQSGVDLQVSFGVAAFDEDPLSGARAAPWRSEVENDLFEGMNLAFEFQARASSDFVLWRMAYDPDGENNFIYEDTEAFGILDGRFVTAFIPEEEWQGVINGRYFGHYAERAGGIGADSYPNIDQPALSYNPLAIPHLVIPALSLPPTPSPAPSPSPVPSPTPSPIPSPTPTPTAASPAATAPATPDGGGAGPIVATPSLISFELLVALLLLLLIILLSLGFFFWRRAQPRQPTGAMTTSEVPTGGVMQGPTQERPRRDLKPPPPPPVEYVECDWAAYYERAGAPPLILRPANGVECCVYRVSLVSTVSRREIVTRGRQERTGSESSPTDRLRLPHAGSWASGLDLGAEAQARSGPQGRLDWMQGMGQLGGGSDVADAAEGTGASVDSSGRQPVDVAARIDHSEVTGVSVKLESNCPGHQTTYELNGYTEVKLEANLECTNTDQPPCPVELTGSGYLITEVNGTIAYRATISAGNDPDEEGVGVALGAHDHAERDRADFSRREANQDFTTVHQDAVGFDVYQTAVLDAGQMVPPQVWPRTERVSVLASASATHLISVKSSMERTECLEGPCTVGAVCHCDPALVLRLEGGSATIEVDGSTFTLGRPTDLTAGKATPWEAG